MAKIIFDNVKIPDKCNNCKHIGHYETGPFARNPHCCCELIWRFTEEEVKVDKNSLYEYCPLKIGYIEVTGGE